MATEETYTPEEDRSSVLPKEVARRKMFVLVKKHSCDFEGEAPKDATQEEHTKWFMKHWFEGDHQISFHRTAEKAVELGIKFVDSEKGYGYWWIVFDKDGKDVNGGY